MNHRQKVFFGGCFGIMILFPDYCMFKICLAEFSDDLILEDIVKLMRESKNERVI